MSEAEEPAVDEPATEETAADEPATEEPADGEAASTEDVKEEEPEEPEPEPFEPWIEGVCMTPIKKLYDVGEELGSPSDFGQTYKGTHKESGEEVAIKTINKLKSNK